MSLGLELGEDFGGVLAEGGGVAADAAFVVAEVDLDADLPQGAENRVVDFYDRAHCGCLIAVEPFFDGAAHGAGDAGIVHDLLPFEGGAAAPCGFKGVYPYLPVLGVRQQAFGIEKRVCPFGVAEGTHHGYEGARIACVDVDPAAVGALVEAGYDGMGLGVVRAFGQDDDLRTHRAEHGVVEGQVDALAYAGGFAVQQGGDDGGGGGERAEDAGVRD